jgi:Ser/Thr protein kinase RdoA (MazF antagonist)
MHVVPLSSDDLARPTRRAVAAASAAGRDLGLAVTAPEVLHDAFSVVVHLAPSPVVARVPVVLPVGLDLAAQRARQTRELSVVTWLADTGCPVVRPSPLVAREPEQRDGFSMTFWELVDVVPGAAPDYLAHVHLAANLHAALRGYAGELPFLAPVSITVPPLLDFLENNPHLLLPRDLERAKLEWSVLAPVLASGESFASAFPNASLQPIHGDAPSYNLIPTKSGPLFADFEDTTIGPVEWDLALLGPDAAAAYNAAAARVGVRPLDPEAMRVMDAARMLQLVTCLALVPDLPMLAEDLAPSLEQWRKMPSIAR